MGGARGSGEASSAAPCLYGPVAALRSLLRVALSSAMEKLGIACCLAHRWVLVLLQPESGLSGRGNFMARRIGTPSTPTTVIVRSNMPDTLSAAGTVTSYAIGILSNLSVIYIVYRLWGWLPSTESITLRLAKIRSAGGAPIKIENLTPVLFITFYHMFIASMFWAIGDVANEVLFWPEFAFAPAFDEKHWNSPVLHAYFLSMAASLPIWRSILMVLCGGLAIYYFGRGIRQAKQCFEVYREIDQQEVIKSAATRAG